MFYRLVLITFILMALTCFEVVSLSMNEREEIDNFLLVARAVHYIVFTLMIDIALDSSLLIIDEGLFYVTSPSHEPISIKRGISNACLNRNYF